MKILALDTSTTLCTVALNIEDRIYQKSHEHAKEHSKVLLSLIDKLLVEHQLTFANLDGIAFNQGPGSFTGLRLCCAVSQAIAFAHDLPAVGVSSLLTIAHEVAEKQKTPVIIASVLDARMNDLYVAMYYSDGNNLIKMICQDSLISINSFESWFNQYFKEAASSLNTTNYIIAGDSIIESLSVENKIFFLPKANYLSHCALKKFQSGEILSPEQIHPHYLREMAYQTQN